MLHTTFEIFANPKSNLDCSKNIERLEGRHDSDKRIAAYREARGCGGSPSPQQFRFYPFTVSTCPCTFQNKVRFSHLWTLFDGYDRHGVLPCPGPLTHQPAALIEAFDILRSLRVSYENKQKATKNGR